MEQALARAMRRYASSVSVVSCRGAQGECYAVTATAVSSVSFEPPSMLVCLNRKTGLASALEQVEEFAINILASDQVTISNDCAGGREATDRVNPENWQMDEGKTPVLKDAQAVILCRRTENLTYGSHEIFIGDVIGADVREDIKPLIYLNGEYGTFVSFGSDDGTD
ncbi:flavin reductase family protein [Emcibacter sp.]|uniref:flavin reductase family protein n=1 Tax=Emcibacter sp. TaxID=1979954 RepID=UPI002AA7CD13|nr:flavin reductase family protein [Emcibacter sp.]